MAGLESLRTLADVLALRGKIKEVKKEVAPAEVNEGELQS